MESLTEHLSRTGILRTPRIIDAFMAIDRKDFVLAEDANEAYEDHPLSIGYGQTISQPTTVATMLELLDPQPGERILDIGSGSGWTTALLGYIVGSDGQVIGIERIPELVKFGAKNLQKYDLPATIEKTGDVLGVPDAAPFDRILVSAGAADVPSELVDQLAINGTLVMPVSDGLACYTKTDHGLVETERIEGFAFVPLITRSS